MTVVALPQTVPVSRRRRCSGRAGCGAVRVENRGGGVESAIENASDPVESNHFFYNPLWVADVGSLRFFRSAGNYHGMAGGAGQESRIMS